MPKPVLSDSLFNADDVATALVNNYNLSVSNQDFAVADRASLFVTRSGWSWVSKQIYSFNGFMFVSGNIYKASTPSNGEVIADISDSNFYPVADTVFNTIAYQGDSANSMSFNASGEIMVSHPVNVGVAEWSAQINGFYRFS